MFILIGVLISLFEMKDLLKERKIKILIFFLLLLIFSIIIYYKRNDMNSLKEFIDKVRGLLNGNH